MSGSVLGARLFGNSLIEGICVKVRSFWFFGYSLSLWSSGSVSGCVKTESMFPWFLDLPVSLFLAVCD